MTGNDKQGTFRRSINVTESLINVMSGIVILGQQFGIKLMALLSGTYWAV